MAIDLQFHLRQKEISIGAYQSIAPRSVGNQQVISYDLLAYDATTPTSVPVPPERVSESQVLADSRLPIVNESIFYGQDENDAWVVSPWLYCVNKRAQRDPQNRLLFHVIAEFATGPRHRLKEEDLRLVPVPADVDSYPFIQEIIWTEGQRVLWQEMESQNDRPLRLPTGSLFSEPFYGAWPIRTIRQTQFEQLEFGNVADTVESRMTTMISAGFAGDPAPSVPTGEPNPFRWKVTQVDPQPCKIPVASGTSAPPTLIDGALMTYTLERAILDGGWMDRRALIDNYYLETANDLTSRTESRSPTDRSTIIEALLNPDGTLQEDQTKDPQFKQWRVLRINSDTSTWLKGAT